MKCPKCNQNEARIHPTYGVMPCVPCQNRDFYVKYYPAEGGIPVSKLHRIQEQRDLHSKDMIQPFEKDQPNPEFIKEYPEESKNYFTKEQLHKSDV